MLRMENVTKSICIAANSSPPWTGDRPHRARRFRGRGRPQRQRQEHAALMLGGMLSPARAASSLEDQSVYDLNLTERASLRREKVGFVFQTFNLVPYLSALENVKVPLFLAGLEEKRRRTGQRAAGAGGTWPTGSTTSRAN